MTKSLSPFNRFTPLVVIATLFLSMATIPARAQEQRIALEVVAGKLKLGVSIEDHRKADGAVAAMIAKQAGFISRETGAGPDGEWFTIVHWATLKDAENAAAVFMQSAEGKVSMTMTDPSSILFKHYIADQ